MTTRIDKRFAALKAEGRAAFVPYVMAGDPDAATALAAGELIAIERQDAADLEQQWPDMWKKASQKKLRQWLD